MRVLLLRFHTYAVAVRRALRDAYAAFVAAYRIAAEKLRGGDLELASRRGASRRRCRSAYDVSESIGCRLAAVA
jgi:hypothetical protein